MEGEGHKCEAQGRKRVGDTNNFGAATNVLQWVEKYGWRCALELISHGMEIFFWGGAGMV